MYNKCPSVKYSFITNLSTVKSVRLKTREKMRQRFDQGEYQRVSGKTSFPFYAFPSTSRYMAKGHSSAPFLVIPLILNYLTIWSHQMVRMCTERLVHILILPPAWFNYLILQHTGPTRKIWRKQHEIYWIYRSLCKTLLQGKYNSDISPEAYLGCKLL